MTIWAALANFEETEKGSLEIGKSGDMVVLNTKVLHTIIDGENVYNY